MEGLPSSTLKGGDIVAKSTTLRLTEQEEKDYEEVKEKFYLTRKDIYKIGLKIMMNKINEEKEI